MEDRSEYLVLAQISQDVIRGILRFLEHNERKALETTIPEIVHYLEAFLSEDALAPQTVAFAGYEKLSTLSEAWDHSEAAGVLGRLLRLQGAVNDSDARAEAEALIGPFQKLSTQALWNFEQPEPELPRGIRALCTAH